MKKVLSFVLVLSMILGSFGMAFAAAPADVVGKDYEDAVNVLVELGVVAGYKDGTFRPENIVTRAEMATFLIKAMGLADYAVGKSSFTDMAGHWADPFVAYASSLGIVAGYADGTFKPDVTVSYDQAITMVIQALGYKGEYLVGGFPGAFVNQAKALGILDGIVSGAAGANRGDIATLLFNALGAEFVRYDKDGGLEYMDDSMMIRLGAGTHEEDGEEEFVVKGTEEAAINIKEYQGALVKAYCDGTDHEECEIIAVKEVKSVFVKGEFDGEKFVAADETEYKIKDSADADEAVYFVNAAEQDDTKALEDLADDETVVAAVKISGKYISEVYSIAKWEAKEPFQWDEDDAEALAGEDADPVLGATEEAPLYINDNDEIEMSEIILVGVEALEDIEEDNIVTYYLGEVEGEEAVVKVEVGTETVEGKISRIKGDKYTINGKAYEIAEDNLLEAELNLTSEGTFYLDYAGNIAAFEGTTTEADDYAVVTLELGTDENLAYGETADLKIKLLTADGKEAVYVVEDDAEITSEAGIAVGEVITYNINKDGKIDKIVEANDVPAGDAELTAKGRLNGVKVSDEVVVFAFDGVDEYTVETLKDVPVEETLGATTYVLNADEDAVMVIYLQGEYGESDDSVYAVLVDFGEVRNADDDGDLYEVEMLVDGAKAEYKTVDDSVVLVEGALVKLHFDGSEIVRMEEIEAEFTTVAAVAADGDIKLEGGSYEYVAEDVVVYLYDEDAEKAFTVSSVNKIKKGDKVALYELDDEVAGYDVIIYIAE